jgi:hypothetical protein
LEDFVDLLEQTGVGVATCTAGDVDLETPEGRLVARITGAVARKESEDKSRRLRRMMVELVENGKPNGGARPFGYQRAGARPVRKGDVDTRHLVVDPDEAPVAREIVERVAAGETLTGVARVLNERGVPNGRGNPWSITNVRNIALNGRYAGLRMHKGDEAGRGDWPAVVDEATWRRARALLTAEDRPKRRTARRYLLSGSLLRCGKCGQPLRSRPMHGRGGPVPVYACRPSTQGGCGGVTVRAEPVERLVADAVIAAVEAPGFARMLQRRSAANPKAVSDAAKVERQMEQLADAFGAGAITMAEWTRAREPLARRLAEAHAQLTVDTAEAAVGRYAGQGDALAKAWPDLALDRQQAIVRSVVEAVVVAPTGRAGNRFDPSRVSITWRH